MDKTPKELAEEYSQIIKASQDVELDDLSWSLISEWEAESFLAGYQAAAPQWISVKDRLPELDVQCFWVDAKSIALSALAAISIDDCIVWWENYTHWMPLPNLPTKES